MPCSHRRLNLVFTMCGNQLALVRESLGVAGEGNSLGVQVGVMSSLNSFLLSFYVHVNFSLFLAVEFSKHNPILSSFAICKLNILHIVVSNYTNKKISKKQEEIIPFMSRSELHQHLPTMHPNPSKTPFVDSFRPKEA